MIINNKYLNKRPTYDIPEGTQIKMYMAYYGTEPTFTPDICINTWGVMGVRGYKETSMQVCIKTSDKGLLKYLKEYNWVDNYSNDNSITGVGKCTKWQIEKLVSEYYRGVEDDNK